MGYGMMGCGSFSVWGKLLWGLLWIVFLVLGSFVFSLVFWATKFWLAGECCKTTEKKHKK